MSNGCADGFCEPVEEIPFETSFRIHWNVGTMEEPLVIDATVLKGEKVARIWLGPDDEPTDLFVKANKDTVKSLGGLLAKIEAVLEAEEGR